MSKQYGNSGRGTAAPAPRGNEDSERGQTPGSNHEDRRQAGSGGDELHKPRPADEASRGGQPRPASQPGGAKHSESEKPSTPDSRWGGGHGPG